MGFADAMLAGFVGGAFFTVAAWATFNYWNDNPMPKWFNAAGKDPFQTVGVMIPFLAIFYTVFSGIDVIYNWI